MSLRLRLPHDGVTSFHGIFINEESKWRRYRAHQSVSDWMRLLKIGPNLKCSHRTCRGWSNPTQHLHCFISYHYAFFATFAIFRVDSHQIGTIHAALLFASKIVNSGTRVYGKIPFNLLCHWIATTIGLTNCEDTTLVLPLRQPCVVQSMSPSEQSLVCNQFWLTSMSTCIITGTSSTFTTRQCICATMRLKQVRASTPSIPPNIAQTFTLNKMAYQTVNTMAASMSYTTAKAANSSSQCQCLPNQWKMLSSINEKTSIIQSKSLA